MPKFTADAVGNPEPVPIPSVCKVIRVQQDDMSGDLFPFHVYQSLSDPNPTSWPGGSCVKFVHPSFWVPGGDAPAYIAADSGSIVFKVLPDTED
jgi:hypothetical protein